MTPSMPFWVGFVLALIHTLLIGLTMSAIIPREPVIWSQAVGLALFVINWVNTILGNPLRPTQRTTLTAEQPAGAAPPKLVVETTREPTNSGEPPKESS